MSNQTSTPINHGRIPYLCSAQTSVNTFCTAKADVVMNDKSKTVLCNNHASA